VDLGTGPLGPGAWYNKSLNLWTCTMHSERRKRFIDEYMIDRNAAQAAIRAGYSRKEARQTGHRLLTDVDIATEIQRRSKAVAEKLGVDLNMVIASFMEAVEMARGKEDARTMLAAAKGLARICGFFPLHGARSEETSDERPEAPEVIIDGKRLPELSVAELEQIVGVRRFLAPALSAES